MEQLKNILSEQGILVMRDLLNRAVLPGHTEYSWATEEFVKRLTSLGISFEPTLCSKGGETGLEFWSVYKFSDTNQTTYIKFNGAHSFATDATVEFTGWEFVEPKQVLITQYTKSRSMLNN